MTTHRQHAETAIDNLVAARAAAHANGDRESADFYTRMIYRLSQRTDVVSPTGDIVAQHRELPGIDHTTTTRDECTVTFRDGTVLVARVTAGHDRDHTLDGRRHDWTITGPAAIDAGAFVVEDHAFHDNALKHTIARIASRAS